MHNDNNSISAATQYPCGIKKCMGMHTLKALSKSINEKSYNKGLSILEIQSISKTNNDVNLPHFNPPPFSH